MSIRYTTVSTRQEVRQILELQARNHVSVVSPEDMQQQGFVTVQYDPEVLAEMNRQYPSVIAKAGEELAGYCLVLPQAFRHDVPVLAPMFDLLDQLSWQGRPLRGDPRWFVMGQVCVAAGYRGQGVFDGLYRTLAAVCRHEFDLVITEVASRNLRSLRAHQRVGFQTLHTYDDAATGENWQVIVLGF